ncbi:arginine deiminase-related protein [soil metagenome]
MAAPDLSLIPNIPRPNRVLLTSPEYFEVKYVINPHMAGNVGEVDQELACRQWDGLKAAYEQLGVDVTVLPGQPHVPDMVFCANQTLPFRRPDGSLGAVMSRMHAPQRRPEVPFYAEFFETIGYEVHGLDPDLPGDFEGMGDAIWHPGRFLLWGGYGHRTNRVVYDRLATKLDFQIIPLELVDPVFYHLDTCFCPLDEATVLIYLGAFTEEAVATIRRYFRAVIESPEDEARSMLSCNAHSPDGRHVIVQRGAAETNRLLRTHGFEPIEVDTDEFLKAGGSVFCMKLMYW